MYLLPKISLKNNLKSCTATQHGALSSQSHHSHCLAIVETTKIASLPHHSLTTFYNSQIKSLNTFFVVETQSNHGIATTLSLHQVLIIKHQLCNKLASHRNKSFVWWWKSFDEKTDAFSSGNTHGIVLKHRFLEQLVYINTSDPKIVQ